MRKYSSQYYIQQLKTYISNNGINITVNNIKNPHDIMVNNKDKTNIPYAHTLVRKIRSKNNIQEL